MAYKDPPKIHTNLDNAEYLLSGVYNQFGITTNWTIEDNGRLKSWHVAGSGGVAGIQLYFSEELFGEHLPAPYSDGDEIDTVITAVIAHEAGHILCKHPQELNQDPNVLAMLDKGQGHKLPYEDKKLVIQTEKEAWVVATELLEQCCFNVDFDDTWIWSLYTKFKNHCLDTYKEGLRI